MSSRFILGMFCAIGPLLLSSIAAGTENPMDCAEEITMPNHQGFVAARIRAPVKVRVLAGRLGLAENVDYREKDGGP